MTALLALVTAAATLAPSSAAAVGATDERLLDLGTRLVGAVARPVAPQSR